MCSGLLFLVIVVNAASSLTTENFEDVTTGGSITSFENFANVETLISDDTTTAISSTTDSTTETSTITSTDESTTTPTTTQEPTTTIQPCTELPSVYFSDVVVSSFSVTLKWNPPDDTDCVETYTIYLDNEIIENTTLTSYEITNLKACSNYQVSISVLYEDNFGPEYSKDISTQLPQDFGSYSVPNFQVVDESEDLINTKWDILPENVNQCVKNYFLEWWDSQNEDDETVKGNQTLETDKTTYGIPITWCMKYKIRIYPVSETIKGDEEVANHEASARPAQSPQLMQFVSTKREVNLTWHFTNENSQCKITEMLVICDSTNSDYPWVIPHIEASRTVPETSQSDFKMMIEGFSPFTNYTCSAKVTNSGGDSTPAFFDISTKEEVPSPPQDLHIPYVTSSSFLLQWKPPNITTGEIISYQIVIDTIGPDFNQGEECRKDGTYDYHNGPNSFDFDFEGAFPYYNYTIVVWAVNAAGDGENATTSIRTNYSEPNPVKNAFVTLENSTDSTTYKDKAIVQFEAPCNTNGPFSCYKIKYEWRRHNVVDSNEVCTTDTMYTIDLLPEMEYSVNISIEANLPSPIVGLTFQSRAGVPTIELLTPPFSNSTTTGFIRLTKNNFPTDNGEVIALCLILVKGIKKVIGNSFGFWDGTEATWPPVLKTQLTPNMWYPFADNEYVVDFIIGADENCKHENYCNKALQENTEYTLIVRAFTRNAYIDSEGMEFKTNMPDSLGLGLILGLVFGILALLALIGCLLFWWRKRQRGETTKKPIDVIKTIQTPPPIPLLKFSNHYSTIKENYDIIKEEFLDLSFKSRDLGGTTNFAQLPENKRKNRYTNILPFDESRVTLKIDEDDEISSDYINATFLKGYSGKIEYIATQGPLVATARDFWKMVVQENVSVIVMVSQFIEQTKEKCYHYFPSNHESVNFGEMLEVRCCTELHFGTYCIRTLQVRKGVEQRDVIHMQFLEWPDFGVPQGTTNMLQFCKEVREKVAKEGGLVVVHCSAGVGRTGTLIALDILLQTIDDHKDINIYKAVFDLRKQRANMVQTEKQYMFLYSCIRDYIESPHIPEKMEDERIYENMDTIRSSMKDTLIEDVLESDAL